MSIISTLTDHAQFFSVPPTAPGSNLNLLVGGVEVAVKPRHVKIRRDGYRRCPQSGNAG